MKISNLVLKIATTGFLVFSFAATNVLADSAPGDVVITLGQNLTQQQKDTLLGELGADGQSVIVEVTNQEEHQYLGKYISNTKIGTKALSSSRITLGNSGEGLTVKTNNINWVSEDMYKNALSTAGIKDAEVYITAPFSVSGTAALTGIIKAYETTSDVKIPEAQKQVANEELVKTAQLGDSIGGDKATELMSLVKASIAEKKPQTDEEMKQVINQAANQVGTNISDSELQGLVDLFNKMKSLNINWDAVNENLTVAKEKLDNFLNQKETQNVIQKLGDFFQALVEAVKSWFAPVK